MKKNVTAVKKARENNRSTGLFTRIMVFGTFDILHPGHLHFFKQARALAKNPYLIVSIARDVSVLKIKGKKPLYGEKKRKEFVHTSGLADRVVLGSTQGHMPHILKEKPNIIAFGYDQAGHYVEATIQYLQEHNIPISTRRLKPHHPDKYKSSIYKAKNLKTADK